MYKVLIADDEYLEREAIKFYLNKFYTDEIEIAAEVANGREAVFQALEKNADIVLMDIQMPRMNGIKASEKLLEKRSEIKIVILTAHDEKNYNKKSAQLGIVDYLAKPYTGKEFTRVIDKALLEIKEKNI